MRRPCWFVMSSAIVLAALPLGCGGSQAGPGVSTPRGSTVGPHGFNAAPLGEGLGFAEVTTEMAQGQADPKLVVYFLGADARSPASGLPTEARATIPGLEPPDVPLVARGEPGRMESLPAAIDPDRVAGELRGTLGGQDFSAPFTVGQ